MLLLSRWMQLIPLTNWLRQWINGEMKQNVSNHWQFNLASYAAWFVPTAAPPLSPPHPCQAPANGGGGVTNVRLKKNCQKIWDWTFTSWRKSFNIDKVEWLCYSMCFNDILMLFQCFSSDYFHSILTIGKFGLTSYPAWALSNSPPALAPEALLRELSNSFNNQSRPSVIKNAPPPPCLGGHGAGDELNSNSNSK